jgi:mTERF domain-containing protein
MAVHAETIGVPRGSGMSRRALKVVAFFSEEKIAVKVQNLENTFRWSEAEAGIVVSKAPDMLTMPKDMLQRKSGFLISEL